jgi:hypothetical protein
VRASALPVRETFMRNVLLAPGVRPRSVEKIFREQARVLAEDGLMVVRETNFDMYHRHFGEGLNRRSRYYYAGKGGLAAKNSAISGWSCLKALTTISCLGRSNLLK